MPAIQSTSEDWTINFNQIQKFNGIIHPECLQWNLQIKLKKVWLKKYSILKSFSTIILSHSGLTSPPITQSPNLTE